MGSKTIRIIGLLSVVMWDRSLLVETAGSRRDLPPGISVPLPYVYPEYVDPRERTTAEPIQDYRTTESTSDSSVGDIIFENVRKTMFESGPLVELLPIVDKDSKPMPIVSPDEQTNRPESSIKSRSNDERIVEKQMRVTNGKVIEETKRPEFVKRRPIRFGTRLVKASTCAKGNVNGRANCRQSLPTTNAFDDKPHRNIKDNQNYDHDDNSNSSSSSDDDVVRKHSVSVVKKIGFRRSRPNAESSQTVRKVPSGRRVRIKSAKTADAEIKRDTE